MIFQIKICGITNVEDAITVADAGADAVGLNFFARSPRFVQREEARQIARALPGGIVKVGLFVNASPDEVCRAFDDLRLDLIQLHGDEPPQFLAELGDRPVMRAFRVGSAGLGLGPVFEYLQQCQVLGCTPRLVLVDSQVAGSYGGTGTIADWTALGLYAADSSLPPLVLAGGLVAENVAEAIRSVRPAAVDTASGVESSPGRKSAVLVRQFVQAAREAFSLLT